MTTVEWIQMFELIPKEQHNQLVITLNNSTDLVVETLFRFEPNYLIMRGRQGGSIDESRAFFVPYDQMLYFRIERVVKLNELYDLMGEAIPDDANEDIPAAERATKAAATRRAAATMVANGPAALTENPIAGKNLLERLRAARATSAATSARQNSKQG